VFILASYIVVALVLAKLRVSMEGVCIYIYVSIYTHTHFFFLKSGAGFVAICCILEQKNAINMPTWLLAFGFGFTWLHLAFGFWLLAFGRWLR
jgi:hypothetical protein